MMLESNSRVFNKPEVGGWTPEASKCAERIQKVISQIMEENKDKFSPDEFEFIAMTEVSNCCISARLGDTYERARIAAEERKVMQELQDVEWEEEQP